MEATRTPPERSPEQLFAQHFPWSRIVADQITRRLPRNAVGRDDARQEAAIGLWEAARRFDPTRDNQFVTYAHRLMRGRVLSFLRDMDHLSRATRSKVKAGLIADVKQKPLPPVLAANDARDKEICEARDLFAEVCRRLRPRVREILVLRAENLTSKEVAARAGYDESYVSQLYAEAVEDSRVRMPEEVCGSPIPIRCFHLGGTHHELEGNNYKSLKINGGLSDEGKGEAVPA